MNEQRQDILISRAVDGQISEVEWNELALLAATEPAIWRDLAQAQRQQMLLERAVGAVMTTADRIEIDALCESREHSAPTVNVAGRIAAWSGWAVAACIAFIWLIGFDALGIHRAANQLLAAQPAQYATAEDALQAYLNMGRATGQVVGEMPSKWLLESRPAENGQGYDVLYMRPIIEKTRVPDLYQATGRDEQGRPTLVHYEQPGRRPM